MSRRVCHLHVGTGKTGSSALQSAFAAERDRLRSHRLAYPDLSGTMAMALAGMPTAGNARDVVVALRRGDVGAAVDLVARHADAEHDIVLSAEGLSGFGEATLAAFAAGLHGLGYDTRALMFARPHTEWVVSAWLQQVKPGRTTSDLVAFTRNWMSPERLASERSHSGRARTLERAIGDLTVHWYPAIRRQGPRGVIEAGFRWLGVEPPASLPTPVVNPTPGREALHVLERIDIPGNRLRRRRFIETFLDAARREGLLGSRVTLPPDLAAEVHAATFDDCASLIRRYCPELSVDEELAPPAAMPAAPLDRAIVDRLTELARSLPLPSPDLGPRQRRRRRMRAAARA